MSPIDPRLQEALDAERDPGELPTDLREAYARLMAAAQLLQTTPRLSVATRIMTEIRLLPAPVHSDGPMRRLIRWFGRPRAVTVRLRPVWTLGLAVGLAAMLLLSSQQDSAPTPSASEGIANFIGHFPGATSVEVVGSFNNWSRGAIHLNDDDHDGDPPAPRASALGWTDAPSHSLVRAPAGRHGPTASGLDPGAGGRSRVRPAAAQP
ncbi:MAG: hypothetical protein DMD66_01100 [Gemmatimonadetes bacterium]|nr:MAG: hypothetical protein DMD66_01100 [Gemmatimonadota bacterium]